ncbi:MAG: dihydrolipoyl dehydrogenase [Opitutae bacterium]|nr:dihydrolipoyl dehydrogenase [Opitutae bacterium]|tara:strand:+ start:160 stop:1506 length:1347 start_codon:yes stop_codon:yes gene_type:complete
MKYDFAVIGAGPAGYIAAKKAASAGKKVLLVEKSKLGGVCLNEGCVPSKTLLQAAKTYHHAKHGSIFGVEAEGVTFNYPKAHEHKNNVMNKMRDGIAGLMKKYKVDVIEGEAKLLPNSQVEISGEIHEATDILLCTGSSPAIPPIPGVELDHVVDSTGILERESLPKHLVVVGGGVIGCEFACMHASVGVPVTVLEAMPEICPNLDSEVSASLREGLTKKGVTFKLGAKVESISSDKVTYSDESGSNELEAELVLVATGRRPNVKNLGLEDLGLDIDDRGGVRVDARGATNIPGLWAAGDVTGQAWLAHAASRMAEVVVNNITGRKDHMRYDSMPAVVYTSPEVAVVGLTKEEAEERGIKVKVGRIPMAINARYIAENPDETGFCKVVLEADTRKLLGVHMVGGACSEMIFGATAMLETELREEEIEEIVFPHPTTSEIIKDVFMAVR